MTEDDEIESMLARAGSLLQNMKGSGPNVPRLTISTNGLSTLTEEQLTTPRILPVVSLDEGDEDDIDEDDVENGVDTMLMKAELLSKTIRSAATGQMNTPELLRASDEILNRANVNQGPSPEADTPTLLGKAKRMLQPNGSPSIMEESVDGTELIHNGQSLTRPPRPPSGNRLPSSSNIMSPLASDQTRQQQQESADNDDNGALMDRAIAAIKSVPTKSKGSTTIEQVPHMPNTIQAADSFDDVSSVGSASCNTSSRRTIFLDTLSTITNGNSTVGGGGPPAASATTSSVSAAVAPQSPAPHSKAAAKAESMAKQMAQALEETLSDTTSLHSSHQDLRQQPQQHYSSPSHAPRLNSRTQEEIQKQLEELRKMDDSQSVNSLGEVIPTAISKKFKAADVNAQWVKVHSANPGDPDYVPIKDYRSPEKKKQTGGRSLVSIPLMKPLSSVASDGKRDSSSSTTVWMRNVILVVAGIALMIFASQGMSSENTTVTTMAPSQILPVTATIKSTMPTPEIVQSKKEKKHMIQEVSPTKKKTVEQTRDLPPKVVSKVKVSSEKVDKIEKAQRHRQQAPATPKIPPTVTARPSPKVTKKNSPTDTARPSPKVTTKNSPAVTARPSPEVTKKSAPKITEKATPKVTPKVVPQVVEQKVKAKDVLPTPVTVSKVMEKAPVMREQPKIEKLVAPLQKVEPIIASTDTTMEFVLTTLQSAIGGGSSSTHNVTSTPAHELEEQQVAEAAAAVVPSRCFVPLGYIVFSKCREIARERPIFDVQSLTDAMLQ